MCVCVLIRSYNFVKIGYILCLLAAFDLVLCSSCLPGLLSDSIWQTRYSSPFYFVILPIFSFLELSVLSLNVWFSIFYGLVCGGYFPFVLFSFALNIYFLCCTQLLWMTILLSVRLPVVMCLRWYPSHHLTASSMLYFRWSLDIQPSPIADRLSLASYMGLNPWSIQYCCLGMKQQLKGFLHCILCLD